jgi:hypothetical protein
MNVIQSINMIAKFNTFTLIANLTKDEIKIEKKSILGIFLENSQINKFLFNNISSFYFPK